MARSFTLVTVDYQDYDTDLIGISKDAWIDESNPTFNHGGSQEIRPGESGGSDTHAIVEMQMPSEDDIIGFDDIFKVELLLYLETIALNPLGKPIVGVIEIPDDWTEGVLDGAAGECNWTKAKAGVAWAAGNGAVKSRKGSTPEEDIVDSARLLNGDQGSFISWDLTRALNMGDKKTFVLYVIDQALATDNWFSSTESGTAAWKPILRLTYRSYPSEGFIADDDKLRIKPNPDDPEQPMLTWGAIEASDFKQYKIYRSTSPITSIEGFKSAITDVSIASDWFKISGDHRDSFPVGSTFKVTGSTGNNGRWTVTSTTYSGGKTQINVSEDVTNAVADGDIHHGIVTLLDSAIEKYVDTDTLSAATTYYYKLSAEDLDNHEDNALLSATVSFIPPDTTTRSLTPNGAINVGTEVTLNVGSTKNRVRKIYIDWKDGSVSWYENKVEDIGIVGTVYHIKHIYSKHSGGGAWTPDVRVEDVDGFWSSLDTCVNTLTISDLTPEAKLIVNVKKAIEGDEVTLNGHLSQPQASNATIARYRFKRYAADSWNDNGTNPVYTFSTTGFGTGTITASLEVRTDVAAGQKIDTDTVTYDLESGTPTEITPGVTGGLSINTNIHELPHRLPIDKSVAVPIGSAGVAYESEIARPPERFTIHATTEYPSMEDDIGLIRDAWLNNSYLRLTIKTEMETKDVQYDFKLDGDVSLGHNYDNKINWSFPIRVLVRTEVAKPKVKGDITAFSNPGGGKVTATSNGHGLKNGMNVLISGTNNYNGTYVVSNVTTNTFRFVATWVANDAKGLWRKVGVS